MTTTQRSIQTAKSVTVAGFISLAASACAVAIFSTSFPYKAWFAGWAIAWLSGTLTSAIQKRGVGADYVPFMLFSYAGIAIRPFVIVLAIAVVAILCSNAILATFLASILSTYVSLMAFHIYELTQIPEFSTEKA